METLWNIVGILCTVWVIIVGLAYLGWSLGWNDWKLETDNNISMVLFKVVPFIIALLYIITF
jgi:hypothetical protein